VSASAPPWSVRALRFARSEAGPLLALLVCAAGLAAFLHLVEEVIREGEAGSFDEGVLQALRVPGDPHQPIGPRALRIAALDLTSLGSAAVLTLITTVVAGFLLIQRKLPAALLLAGTVGGGALLSDALKRLYERQRPPLEYRAAEAFTPSFPSGHAMLSAVVYLTLGALLARALPQKRLKLYVMSVAVLLTTLVGFTRVYLGVHWATDVLAGWCLGAAWAMACWLASFAWERATARRLETPAPR
jgi:undecaprenyl-diphosphatase